MPPNPLALRADHDFTLKVYEWKPLIKVYLLISRGLFTGSTFQRIFLKRRIWVCETMFLERCKHIQNITVKNDSLFEFLI